MKTNHLIQKARLKLLLDEMHVSDILDVLSVHPLTEVLLEPLKTRLNDPDNN